MRSVQVNVVSSIHPTSRILSLQSSFQKALTFDTEEYLEMIALAAMMVLFCFFIPKRRFTGTEAAQVWAREATDAHRNRPRASFGIGIVVVSTISSHLVQ